jgi:predicted metalloprotease
MASQSTARCLELHADFMAGFYFGVRAASKDLDVKPFAKSLFSKGDWAFNEPNHHGTPQEREDAMYAGFDLGKTSDATLVQAAAQGVRHVKSQ